MNRSKRLRVDLEQDTAPSVDQQAGSKPQLTRACAECKKHKIKCFVLPGNESCTKCLKSGIQCVPHNLAQKFMDEDAAWKSQATMTIDQLKTAVGHLLQHNNLSDLSTYLISTSRRPIPTESSIAPASPTTTNHSNTGKTGNFTSEGPSALHHEDDSELVPLPMNNLYNLTDPGKSRLIRVDPSLVNGPDFISRGIVSLAEAEFLFDHFRNHINPLLWDGILCSHKSLSAARESSSLLIATVLTVAALHIPHREKILSATYDAFVTLMRASCLLRSQNLDDIRGLCIGAFYLTSLSWALCSRAVRVATEMNLHKSSLQFSRDSLESYERVRLWYVLYVCDHQFALAYGRPPMMHDDAAIRNADKLLLSSLSSEGDRGLVAQVKLFRILAGCYFMYGCDADLISTASMGYITLLGIYGYIFLEGRTVLSLIELSGQDFEILQSFNIQLDQWRFEHQPKSLDPARENLVPTKAITLYYNLARFQLNSLSLRGISATQSSPGPDMNWDRQEAANNAISAATSTVRLTIEDSNLRNAQIGMPIFVHAMIAVCASFLLKLAVVFSEPDPQRNNSLYLPRDLTKYGLSFHTGIVLSEVGRLVDMLGAVADRASQQHVASQVVTGLRELLQRFSPGADGDSFIYSRQGGMAVLAPEIRAPNHDASTECERYGTSQAQDAGFSQSYIDTSSAPGQDHRWIQPSGSGQQQDPFDLWGGDLDWRLDDAFLLGIHAEESYM